MAKTNLLQRLVDSNNNKTDATNQVRLSITNNVYAILTTEPDADCIRPDYGLGAYFNDRKLSPDIAQQLVNNIFHQCQLFETRLKNVVVNIDINNTEKSISPITINILGQYSHAGASYQYQLSLEYNTEFKLIINE